VTFLVAALAAPAAGPLLYRVLHPRPVAVRLVDGFVYVAVPVLVALQVLPFAWEHRSLLALALLGLGLLVPLGMERVSRLLAERTDDVAIVVGLSGLVVHAMLEGAALAPGAAAVAPAFGTAVVLHRVPVGLVVWWLVRPRHGIPMATLAVACLVIATLAGVGAGEVAGALHGPGIELYQAFVSGSLVHVVFHQGRHDHDHDHGDGGHGHHGGADGHSGSANATM